ncbi:MAG TPA: ubiquitin-like protein Pup [Methylomirabilota bacterium]
MAQETKQTKTASRSTETVEQDDRHAGGPAELAKKGETLSARMDDLLDEIDDVLEENAEEFVKGYVQRGGQ